MLNDDLRLLREYSAQHSNEAFATLVSRYVNLVYSVALRQVRDPHLAEEITQAVFIILARKAGSINDKAVLSGWLCRTARYASANALTVQRRRQRREQEAQMQPTANELAPDSWPEIGPLLDRAMEQLGGRDHDAVVLRFFEGKTFGQIGGELGTSSDAAKMRVSRALEKLRKILARNGIRSTAEAVGSAISANGLLAAPPELAKHAAALAIYKGAACGLSTNSLVSGTMKTMTWLNLKAAAWAGVAAVAAFGVSAIVATRPLHPEFHWFLRHPPMAYKVVYDRESTPSRMLLPPLPPDFPIGTFKDSFTIVRDGDNYRVDAHEDTGTIMRGKYGTNFWFTVGAQLHRFTTSTTRPVGPKYWEQMRMIPELSLNEFQAFGVYPVGTSNMIWASDGQNMTFSFGFKYTVHFDEENGVPVRANIINADTGRPDALIVYHYDPDFCRGRLPVEITHYLGGTTNEERRVSDIRIRSLELPRFHLSSTEFDPDRMVKNSDPGYPTGYYSNDTEVYVYPPKMGRAD